MTEQSLYSWQSSDFEIQLNPDFAKRASFIWVFNWHEIPHLGLSINGLYFSISISGIQQNVDIANIWRLCEIKSIPLFLIELVDYELDPNTAASHFSNPIQTGETCLNPIKNLLLNQDENVQTLSHLIKKLEENEHVLAYYANGLISKDKLTLLNYNKTDVLEMITNKMLVYETRK